MQVCFIFIWIYCAQDDTGIYPCRVYGCGPNTTLDCQTSVVKFLYNGQFDSVAQLSTSGLLYEVHRNSLSRIPVDYRSQVREWVKWERYNCNVSNNFQNIQEINGQLRTLVTLTRAFPTEAHLEPLPHDKYYDQRYRLFRRFDEGIVLDTESWYSVSRVWCFASYSQVL